MREYICPICGNKFLIVGYVSDWTYKAHDVPVCSDSCSRKYELSRVNKYKAQDIKRELSGEFYTGNGRPLKYKGE